MKTYVPVSYYTTGVVQLLYNEHIPLKKVLKLLFVCIETMIQTFGSLPKTHVLCIP